MKSVFVIIITKDRHLDAPYFITEGDTGKVRKFDTHAEAKLLAERIGGVVFSYEE